MTNLDYDDYGEVINGEGTYAGIAEDLKVKSVIVGWSDGKGTHLDVLFSSGAIRFGSQIQGGIRPASDLFVSIMRMGAFAFDPFTTDTHPTYYDEKLARQSLGSECAEALAELINGVKRHLINA